MLNAETKRRIDACRDILVGKIPSPQAQVEQITIALMYKFMNDLDHEVVDLGGTSQFFSGEFAKFSWDRIVDPRIGGEERIRLYAEGLEKVGTNTQVPELFRQIFKNAFLPYRDPETFNLFSQAISCFRYEHSEDLGDAFEYLLSVLQSQGDAGQFRTPRHIIDFMAEVVAPQPGETILDPACGTAGFLIAAYKYIRKHHRHLSPEQLEALHRNVTGYDISPDMVRLSRVNLYLHQFADPQVSEYDTLTDQTRWGDKFDVVLANPPFMTPKGGIRPHRKFSLESNRSEVLFVDYIAEHLKAGGRGAVIVPEGIIFQSGKAYRQLRRMLLEGYLWGVVSLPAGVFNPYSGVKTSILLLDRKVAEMGGPVIFVQVKADGYDLGAQRRPVVQNDLPEALKLIQEVHGQLVQGVMPPDFWGSMEGWDLTNLVVPRKLITEEPDCNLSGERYRPAEARGPRKWPMVKLGEVCEIERGASPRPIQSFITQEIDGVNWIKIGDGSSNSMYIEKTEEKITQEGAQKSRKVSSGDLILSNSMSFGHPYILKIDGCIHDGWLALRDIDSRISKEFLYHLLSSKSMYLQFQKLATGGVVNNLNSGLVRSVSIPLPPLSVQEEIVAEVGRYQVVIDGARAVVENWKPSFTVDPDWPVVKLGEVCVTTSGGTPLKSNVDYWKNGDVPWLKSGEVAQGEIWKTEEYITELALKETSAKLMPVNTVLVAMYGATAGQSGILKIVASTNQAVCGILPSESFVPEFLLILMRSNKETLVKQSTGGAQPNISQQIIRNLQIPIPPLHFQKEIVARIETERALVKANEELMELMKKRIEETVERVWG